LLAIISCANMARLISKSLIIKKSEVRSQTENWNFLSEVRLHILIKSDFWQSRFFIGDLWLLW